MRPALLAARKNKDKVDMSDFEVAKEIKPSIAEEFTKVGVQTTKKSFFQ